MVSLIQSSLIIFFVLLLNLFPALLKVKIAITQEVSVNNITRETLSSHIIKEIYDFLAVIRIKNLLLVVEKL